MSQGNVLCATCWSLSLFYGFFCLCFCCYCVFFEFLYKSVRVLVFVVVLDFLIMIIHCRFHSEFCDMIMIVFLRIVVYGKDEVEVEIIAFCFVFGFCFWFFVYFFGVLRFLFLLCCFWF